MKTKRPILISILCALSLVGVIMIPFMLISGTPISPVSGLRQANSFPVWYICFGLLINVGYFFATIETWRMKKVGVELYALLAIIEYIISFSFGFNSICDIIFVIISIGLLLIYYKKMTRPSLFDKLRSNTYGKGV